MKEIIIATKNRGKVRDFEQLFSKKGIKVKSLLDFPDLPDVEETGTTFIENAVIKAESIVNELNKPVIADDSGLSVDVLGGEPGVYSARYAGPNKNDEENIQKVLHELKGVPSAKRTGRFHCALALAIPNGKTHVVEGTCEGLITNEPIGDRGFGYDPVFFVKEKGKTMAELTNEQKNEISHRAKALQKLVPLVDKVLLGEEDRDEGVNH